MKKKKRIIMIFIVLIILLIPLLFYFLLKDYMTSIIPLDKTITEQIMYYPQGKDDITLPKKLKIKNIFHQKKTIDVTWVEESQKKDKDTIIYTYIATAPKKHQKLDMPKIKAIFRPTETTLTGLPKEIMADKAMIEIPITLSPSFKRPIHIEMWENDSWNCKKKLNAPEAEEASVSILLPDDWAKQEKSKWRLYLPDTYQGFEVTSDEFTIITKPLKTSVTNLAKNQKAVKNMPFSISFDVSPAYKRKGKILKLVDAKWQEITTFETEENVTSKVNITLEKNWVEKEAEYKIELASDRNMESFISDPIKVETQNTSISNLKTELKGKKDSSLEKKITITPALKRTIDLEKKVDNKWIKQKTFETENSISSNVTITFPKDWDKEDTSTWRLVASKTDHADAFTSNEITVMAVSPTIVKDLKTNYKEKAGSIIKNEITISPAKGRNLYVKQKINGTWVTKGTYKLKDTQTDTITINIPSDWYKSLSSTWQISIPQEKTYDSYQQTIEIETVPVYQNPEGYLQIQDHIFFTGGNYELKQGTMGLKVLKVQKKLGIQKERAIVDVEFINKVKDFQRSHGLKVDGIVGLKTWLSMGFSGQDWKYLGAYVTPKKTDYTATKEKLIETMIATAKTYIGTPYVIGAAGRPGQGIDCSGLVMQAMYSVGINPLPVSVVRHSKPGYEYESYYLWNHKKIKHVPYEERQRGDLIFYKDKNGYLNHVAIYLGNDQVIESWPPQVVIWPIINEEHPSIIGVARIFN